MVERTRLQAEECRKAQETKNEAIRLNTEAVILENTKEDSESLKNRLNDVAGEFENKDVLQEVPKSEKQLTKHPSPIQKVTKFFLDSRSRYEKSCCCMLVIMPLSLMFSQLMVIFPSYS